MALILMQLTNHNGVKMNRHSSSKYLGLILCVAFSHAAVASNGTWYAGAAVGSGYVKDDAPDSGLAVTRDSTATGYKLYAGYQIMPNMAIEGAYTDVGKEKFAWRYSATESGAGTIKVKALSLSAIAIAPLSGNFSAFAKLGVANLNTNYNESWSQTGYAATLSEKKSKTVAHYGAGITYALKKGLAIRAEFEAFGKGKVGDTAIKSRLLSLGLQSQF
jgi:OOP family OmpA-OmpF porin